MNTIDLNPKSIDQARNASLPQQDRRSWWATMFLLCGILGAMLGLSVRTQTVKQHQEKLDRLQGTEMLAKANADLQRRVAQLQKDNAQLVNSVPSDTKQVKTLSEDLAKAQFLAGLTDVKGQGIIVTLNDSKKPAVDMPQGIPMLTPPNIIHDTDINQVVNEAKASGAEAISVNDQRLVSASFIRCAGPTVYVNNTPQTPPYVIKIIGSPKTLAAALNLPGGIADQIRHYDTAMFKIEKSPKLLTVPAYAGGGLEPKFSQPVMGADTGKKLGA